MKTAPTKDLELQRLELEQQRFKLEQQGTIFRYVAILGGIATFAWSSYTYFDTAHRERDKLTDERAKQADERARATAAQRIAGMQPFLERQLRLFEETTQTTAFLATTLDSPDRAKRIEKFWQLYWGELALVEHGKVESAMVAFGNALTAGADKTQLQRLALDVTYACRNELAESWAEPSWRHNE